MVKYHILFIRRTYGFGGCEIILLDWLKNIDYNKCKITVVTTHNFISNNLDNQLYPVHNIIKTPGWDFKFLNIYKWFRLFWKLRPNKIIYIQGDFFEIPLFLLIIGFVFSNGNGVMTQHTVAPKPPVKSRKYYFKYIPGIGLWWYKTVLKIRFRYYFLKNIFVVSQKVKESVIDWGYPVTKIKIMIHGINTDIFYPSQKEKVEMRLKNNIPLNAQVIISTARISSDKNPFRLISLYNKLGDNDNNLWLIMIGEGPLSNLIHKNIKNKQRVKILGALPREEVAKYLICSDIFVLPSDVEGFGIALIEAMATGLICIAIKGSGPDDIIKNGINGFLLEAKFEDYVYKVRDILALDATFKQKISLNAYKTIKDNYQLKNVIKDVFQNLEIPFKYN